MKRPSLRIFASVQIAIRRILEAVNGRLGGFMCDSSAAWIVLSASLTLELWYAWRTQ